jgi:DNA gyrase subunit A
MSGERVIPTYIEDEMKTSYLDYSMSVIISRALPDVRDGLKPVHRRILYGMYDLGLHFNRPFKKCARIVGDVMGKYHPHGDMAIYDALVRMVQEFSLRYPLINGQGNFGSIDGDSAAAMRYTECRMQRFAEEMLRDIDKETVDFVPNFDESLEEPSVLPAAIPNLLINGVGGIAVGMATNIPPHNLTEVMNAVIATIDNPDLVTADYLKFIPGPDFPTGGIILGRQGIADYFEKGRGKLIIRAKANIETLKSGRKNIIITELPYQVNKADLLQKIADLVNEKKIEGISDMRDESDRDGIRVVIELKKDSYEEVVLNQLYKFTSIQTSFGVIMLALVNKEPRVLSIKELISHFISHRHDILVRKTNFELKKAEEKAHLLEGLKIALDHIDEIVALIKASKDTGEARQNLMTRFGLSEKQAVAILEMRLQRLTGLERDKIEFEYLETIKLIEELKSILENQTKRMAILKDECLQIKEKYGDERKTEIVNASGDFSIEDVIAEEDMVVTISHTGYIKRLPVNTYKSQNRGGRGVTGMETKEEDFVEHLFIGSTHSYILFFTNHGRCYWLKVHEIPQGGRLAKGKAIINLLELKPDEKIKAFVPVRHFDEDHYLVMATKQGIINKIRLSLFSRPRRDGIIAIKLNENDDLIESKLTDGSSEVVLATKDGQAIRFGGAAFREQGRGTTGVRGIRLDKNDEVVAMVVVNRPDASLLSVTENGFGKRTSVGEYRITNRGGKGIINIQVSERNGKVITVQEVVDQDELMIISRTGNIIRFPAKGISKIGRNTQGVKLINMTDDDKVIDVARVIYKEGNEAEGIPEETPAE